ncbi:NAD-dependent epimerase/dehydratase family protein [Nannocystaceae bacterium ST9]
MPETATDRNPSAGIPTGKVLVTGASGHVGSNLVRHLLEAGQEVRALVQPNADNRSLEGLDVERVEGDIREFDSMLRASKGAARVFHVAAKISTASATPEEERSLYGINVLGTRNVARACLENGVGRMVLTGSFSATGFDLDDPSKPSDETIPFYPFGHTMPYAHTKALAEHQVLEAVAEGLDAVIATSCGCIGPWDYLPSRMGGTICDYVNGKLRVYIDGGFMWIRAHDIATGHLLAMEYGRKGQKYLFATEFMTLQQLFDTVREVAQVEHGLIQLPREPVRMIAALYSGTLAHLFPKASQRLTPGSIAVLEMRRHVDYGKAARELGYRPTSLREGIAEAVEFFQREGMIHRARTIVRAPVHADPTPAE